MAGRGQEALSMDRKGYVGAKYDAKKNGQIIPPNGRRVLRDGTVITNIVISRKERQGLVEGIRPDGTPFSIMRSLESIGL